MTEISVHVLKHDGTEYRRWNARVRRSDDQLMVLDAEFDIDVSHHLLGEIHRGTRTIEYYWLDRWYNVFRFLEKDGSTRLWYCNINTPPVLSEDALTYIDLDIDVLVKPDFSYQVLDLDEFETNAKRYGYSAEEKQRSHAAVHELIRMIDRHQFPFLVQNSAVSSVVK